MLDKIIFYNFWHTGDIFVSRNFVNFIVENILAKEYIYYHTNSEKILKDISKLKHQLKQLPEDYCTRGWWLEDNNLWCNTWYNAYNYSLFSGCTIYTLYSIFKKGLKETIDFDLPREILDYLPTIDYSYFPIDNSLLSNGIPKVLICNCYVMSGQSKNFDFNPIIFYVSEIFPNVLFFVTNVIGPKVIKNNVKYIPDLLSVGDCDLNEISYISKFCKLIVGRNSGPHTFCFTKDNLMDKNKTFLCFSPENFGVAGIVNSTILCYEEYGRDRVAFIIEQEIKRICGL